MPIAQLGPLAPGEQQAVQVRLKSGDYRIVCTVVGYRDGVPTSHLRLGMESAFEVAG
jgi:hypothetical protein